MYKISGFARISCVSVKTLRYYDSMDLLKPAHVDDRTGYRYYVREQLSRLHRILAFKELGFSLDQIASALKEEISSERLQELLNLKQKELEQRVSEEQARLERVQALLQQIEAEGTLPENAPVYAISFCSKNERV